jgi:hypothetical protein
LLFVLSLSELLGAKASELQAAFAAIFIDEQISALVALASNATLFSSLIC